jgi:hypothetical protein
MHASCNLVFCYLIGTSAKVTFHIRASVSIRAMKMPDQYELDELGAEYYGSHKEPGYIYHYLLFAIARLLKCFILSFFVSLLQT